MHSTKLLRKPLSHTNVLQRLIRMQSSALYITFNFCYRSIDKWYTQSERILRTQASCKSLKREVEKKESSGYVKDATTTVATIWFQMPQIRKEMPWNHFEIIRTNKFVDRFQLVGLCLPFLSFFRECAPLLDRLIGTRRHSALNTHTHPTWHVLRNKSSKCYRKLHTFIRFTRFRTEYTNNSLILCSFVFVFLMLLLSSAIWVLLCMNARATAGRQTLLADWLFRLIAFYNKKSTKINCTAITWNKNVG